MIITFKKFIGTKSNLFEELNPSQVRMASEWTPERNLVGTPNYRKTFDLPENVVDDSVHPEVEEHLNNNGYSVKNSNIATRQVTVNHPIHGVIQKQVEEKIGTALEKTKAPDEIKQKFTNAKNRALNKSKKKQITITSNPLDAAAISTGRGWNSCTNLGDGVDQHGMPHENSGEGCNSHYVEGMAKSGTVSAYLHDEGAADGQQIKSPSARIQAKLYHAHINGIRTGKIALQMGPTYGAHSPELRKAFQEWIDKNHPFNAANSYTLDHRQYADGADDEHIGHGILSHSNYKYAANWNKLQYAATEQHIPDHIKRKIIDDDSEHALELAKNPHLSNSDIHDMLDASNKTKFNLSGRTDLDSSHISRLLLKGVYSPYMFNLNKDSVTTEHFDDVLHSGKIRDFANQSGHPEIKQRHLDAMINEGGNPFAIGQNAKKLSKEQLSKINWTTGLLNNNKIKLDSDDLSNIINKNRLTHYETEKIIKNHEDKLKDEDYQELIKDNPNAVAEHTKNQKVLSQLVALGNEHAGKNKNLTEEHIDKIINEVDTTHGNSGYTLKNLADNHAVKLKPEQINKISKLDSDEFDIKPTLMGRPDLTQDHINKFIDDGYNDTREDFHHSLEQLIYNKHIKLNSEQTDKITKTNNLADEHQVMEQLVRNTNHEMSPELIHHLLKTHGTNSTVGNLINSHRLKK
jgi:hypothetical protein